MSNALKAIAMTDNELRVANHIILFGGSDLVGEHFTPDTEIESGYTKSNGVVVDWEHGLAETDEDEILGRVDWATAKKTESGVWVERVLDRHNRYMQFIEPLIEAGIVGTSSEAIGKSVEKDDKGEIKKWPIKRDSLTVQPMEPRMLTSNALAALKSLADISPAIKSIYPDLETDSLKAEPVQPATDDVTVDMTIKSVDEENIIMSDEKEAPDNGVLALEEKVDALTESMATIAKALQAQPAKKSAGIITDVDDEADRAAKGNPFKSFGDFLTAVKDAGQGQIDQRLYPMKSKDPMNEGGYSISAAMGKSFTGSIAAAKAAKAAPTGLGESSGPAGGYLTSSEQAPGILSRVYESGQLLSRVAMDQIGPNANGMTYYADAETSRADGSRHGGVRGYWVAENSAPTASNPTFRVMELKLRKAAALLYATDELLADATALESYVMRLLPEELRFIVEDAIVNGLGTGQPLGILNSNATVSVSKETGQAAATLVAENVVKMWARLWGRSQRNAIWLINQDVQPQLWQLSLPIGTGGQMVYIPPGGFSASPYGTLFGRPVIVHESCATLGTVGDILLVDPMEYQMIEKGGVEAASSIHVRFTQGEQTFRFIYRVDGQPRWSAALTPFKGSNTVSPFISLATRA